MSDEAERTPGFLDALAGGGRVWAWIGLPALALLVVLLVLIVRAPVGKQAGGDTGGVVDNELASARSALSKSTDLATCRAAIQRFNAHLALEARHRPPALSPDQAQGLRRLLSLDDGDAAELAGDEYTPLDAYHLETCLLLRDAASSLEVLAPAGKNGKQARLTPVERAEAAFAWTCRQVRLYDGEGPPAPPAFVLRRGWGTALERGLVFAALLEQMGASEGEPASLQGCLLKLPAAGASTRLWACGVAVGDKPAALLLFDPRMGLPLPGPGGKGIATLAQAQKDPAVLGQLESGKLAYDATAEQAAKAQVLAVCPLSAASPRMRVLQDVLLRQREWRGKPLPPPVLVRLAEDAPQALARIRMAVQAGGAQTEAVGYLPEGAALARHSLTREEGGSDTGVRFAPRLLPGYTRPDDPEVRVLPRSRLLELASVPWQAFPEVFRRERDFRFDTGIGGALRGVFMAGFTKALRDPSSVRDAILRGRVDGTVTQRLVKERDYWLRARLRKDDSAEVAKGVADWIVLAKEADIALARAENDGGDVAGARAALGSLVRFKVGDPVEVKMVTAMAGPQAADLTYQLGLCLHERANRMQTRHALAARAGVGLPDELKRARLAWEDAEDKWMSLLRDFPGDPSTANARRLRGEALSKAGEPAKARQAWLSPVGRGTALERLGDAWLADRPSSR